jgi:hypothetical protein
MSKKNGKLDLNKVAGGLVTSVTNLYDANKYQSYTQNIVSLRVSADGTINPEDIAALRKVSDATHVAADVDSAGGVYSNNTLAIDPQAAVANAAKLTS